MDKVVEKAFNKFADESGANSEDIHEFNYWHDMMVDKVFEAGWTAAMKHIDEGAKK